MIDGKETLEKSKWRWRMDNPETLQILGTLSTIDKKINTIHWTDEQQEPHHKQGMNPGARHG